MGFDKKHTRFPKIDRHSPEPLANEVIKEQETTRTELNALKNILESLQQSVLIANQEVSSLKIKLAEANEEISESKKKITNLASELEVIKLSDNQQSNNRHHISKTKQTQATSSQLPAPQLPSLVNPPPQNLPPKNPTTEITSSKRQPGILPSPTSQNSSPAEPSSSKTLVAQSLSFNNSVPRDNSLKTTHVPLSQAGLSLHPAPLSTSEPLRPNPDPKTSSPWTKVQSKNQKKTRENLDLNLTRDQNSFSILQKGPPVKKVSKNSTSITPLSERYRPL